MSSSKLPVDTPKNISKLHIDRIKREEEEDQWISGEELNTDGSSDEEEKGVAKGGSRSTRRQGARPKAQKFKRPDVPPLAPPSNKKEEGGSDSADELVDISWKPKRGSIRLPHVITDRMTLADILLTRLVIIKSSIKALDTATLIASKISGESPTPAS